MNIYSESQIRALERCAIERGISGDEMMRRAGQAAFDFLRERFAEAESIVVFCGGGNNGGDGYVIAKLAQSAGLTVRVRYLGEAIKAQQVAHVDIKPFDLNENLDADLFVDALFGIGLKKTVRGKTLQAIRWINDQITPVFAIDLPSGIHADSGDVLGGAIYADATITFIGLKQGLVTGDALNYCGEVIEETLEFPEDCFGAVTASGELITIDDFQRYLMPREPNSHKGDFGHVLVVGGDEGMPGAPKMAAMGAARSGSGLTTIATHDSHATFLSMSQPELMCYGVKFTKQLTPLIKRATVLVLGPGLGKSSWGRNLFKTLMKSKLPMVVDADGLNLLALKPNKNSYRILTPHPGEAARLLHCTTKEIQQNRIEAAKSIQKKYGGVCVLKGAGTIIVDDNRLMICMDGNPGMASGGMGDVLSGVIGGLLAQGLPLFEAAACGVCVHARAGDLAAEAQGQCGLLATDLLPFVRRLVNLV